MTFGFRELSEKELDFVAGGTIVVTGTRTPTTPYAAGIGQIGGMGSWRSGDASAREDAEEQAREESEEEEEIVVTANIVQLGPLIVGDDHYAIYDPDRRVYDIYKQSDWFWNQGGDGYVGSFIPANSADASMTITQNSNTQVGADAQRGPNGPSGNAQLTSFAGSAETWLRVDPRGELDTFDDPEDDEGEDNR